MYKKSNKFKRSKLRKRVKTSGARLKKFGAEALEKKFIFSLRDTGNVFFFFEEEE